MDRPFILENTRERERLGRIVEGLTDVEFGLPMDDGWTVAVTLAHLAFWDHRTLILLRKWKAAGRVELSAIDVDITNDTLLPLLQGLSGRAAADLALSAAAQIDRELEHYPADLVSAVEAAGERNRLYRAVHRKWHLDRLEERLREHRSPAGGGA
jgi:hypothetical protein